MTWSGRLLSFLYNSTRPILGASDETGVAGTFLSQEFAQNARGVVHVFLKNPRQTGDWIQTELPALRENVRVSVLVIHDLAKGTIEMFLQGDF